MEVPEDPNKWLQIILALSGHNASVKATWPTISIFILIYETFQYTKPAKNVKYSLYIDNNLVKASHNG